MSVHLHRMDDRLAIYAGDCRDTLRLLGDSTVDAVVTDPPYELGFMGKTWDGSGIAYDTGLWREALRVLKPGGHLLAFGGTRTWHRLACAIEDAGFEVRDSIAWLYGSGFPKSLDVSKAIDKLDATAERRTRDLTFTAWMRGTGITSRQINETTDTNMGGHYLTDAAQPAVATADLFDKLRHLLPEVPANIEALVAQRTVESANYKAREVVGIDTLPDTTKARAGFVGMTRTGDDIPTREVPRTLAHTPDAARWAGWGTALKPAFEPIVVARKPLIGTVANNVLTHGVGALNVDGCRIGTGADKTPAPTSRGDSASWFTTSDATNLGGDDSKGRWPANVTLDETQAAALDEQSGFRRPGERPNSTGVRSTPGAGGTLGDGWAGVNHPERVVLDAGGGASRFFYVAKAPTKERPKVDGVAHPTVKPLTLMRWLVRLVTPPGGIIVEPFAGSGTTIEAALLEGFRIIASESTPEYLPLIDARIDRAYAELGVTDEGAA